MHQTLSSRLARFFTDCQPLNFKAVYNYQRDERNSVRPNDHGLLFRVADVASRIYDLGCTAFGGPPVHFQIFHHRFVEQRGRIVPWVSEQTYQELFAVSQALPGPASTKMLFCMILVHAGFVCAVMGFLIWSLPGALGMFLLALGVSKIDSELPGIACALLTGLNAATVGIIALAATQLAAKAITDRLSRILVILGASAGLCYSALWYFPVIMVVGAVTTPVWDLYLSRVVGKYKARLHQRRSRAQAGQASSSDSAPEEVELERLPSVSGTTVRRIHDEAAKEAHESSQEDNTAPKTRPDPATLVHSHEISPWVGISIIVLFFISFAAVLATRSLLSTVPRPFDLFTNMYLAGTIIFGGGPVVIPLLREYAVGPGWVSSRDFLIGLAIIQAFPGPNFNFAVYLGALALQGTPYSPVFGAIIGFCGIFAPGLTLSVGVQGIWALLRTKAVVVSVLRGINATAVGLVFTAVYRLWEIGYLMPSSSSGHSLALDPWWVVVAAVTYSGSSWFGVAPPIAIMSGGLMGLVWYGVAGRHVLG